MTLRDWQALGIGMILWACCGALAAQELTPWTNDPTPPLTLSDVQGTSHTLAAYRGQVVLVNFWATWCEPCREEMPALQALQQKLGKERLIVLAVNYGESPEKVHQFTHNMPLDFPLLLDRDTQAAKAWQVRMLPTTFVLGQDGKIQYRAVGVLEWGEAQVVKLLAALAGHP
jgi:thiol-disulfide isomerase/thioredoxin